MPNSLAFRRNLRAEQTRQGPSEAGLAGRGRARKRAEFSRPVGENGAERTLRGRGRLLDQLLCPVRSRSGTRPRRDALRARKRFAPGKTLDRTEFTSGRPNQIRGPRGALPRWARDIILSGCLINYYAQLIQFFCGKKRRIPAAFFAGFPASSRFRNICPVYYL